jgi:hypothetical protein
LDEIEGDRRWEEEFVRSPGKLGLLETGAAEQVEAGQAVNPRITLVSAG